MAAQPNYPLLQPASSFAESEGEKPAQKSKNQLAVIGAACLAIGAVGGAWILGSRLIRARIQEKNKKGIGPTSNQVEPIFAPKDKVEEASVESFPASDPPGW